MLYGKKLSIITINYNNLAGLQKTTESVVAQTCSDFEWIVIDGGSTDGSKEFLEKNSEKITYWVSERDRGIYHAMNKGVSAAKGDYCLFLNSGDRLHSNDTVMNILRELHDEDILSGDEWWVDEDYTFKKVNSNPDILTPYRLLVGILWHQCTFIKRVRLLEHPYDESLRISSDWEEMFYELIVRKGTYRHLPYIVSDFIAGGISENMKLIAIERGKVLDKYLSKKEQHTIALEHLCQYDDMKHNRQIAELAFSSFVNGWYNNNEYNELFSKYWNRIIKGPIKYSFFIILCFWGQMNIAKKLFSLIKGI